MNEQSSVYIRCLFCLSGKERDVAERINKSGLGNAFHPCKTKPFFKRGQWVDVPVSLLPGYVFVISDQPEPLSLFWGVPDVIRPLTYGPDDNEGYLTGSDRALALWLIQENGLVGKLNAIKEGGCVRIVDGLMKHFNGRVLRIDRRKRMANIELEVMGRVHSVWLGIQFLESSRDGAIAESDRLHANN